QPQIGPGALLHPGNRDQRPFPTCRGVRTEQGDAVTRRGGGREAVSGDALRIEVVDEAVDGCTWQPVRIAGGGIEQRDDPVEIPVRAVTERPTALGLPQPTPLQTALLPQPPQDLFEPGSRLVSLPRGRQQVDDSTYRRRLHLAESGENVRAPQREHQQFVTR